MRETHGCDGCENQEAFLAPYRFAPECSQREIAANRFTSIAVVPLARLSFSGIGSPPIWHQFERKLIQGCDGLHC